MSKFLKNAGANMPDAIKSAGDSFGRMAGQETPKEESDEGSDEGGGGGSGNNEGKKQAATEAIDQEKVETNKRKALLRRRVGKGLQSAGSRLGATNKIPEKN